MVRPVDHARRNLLRGLPAVKVPPVRPPGAAPEHLFNERCTACGDCVKACPECIVTRGSAGFPEIDFRLGECTFCDLCVDACDEEALLPGQQPPWHLRITLDDSCLAVQQVVCEACRDSCGADAIRFRPRLRAVAIPDIDEDACTGCGACIAACPQGALEAVRDD